MKNENTCKSVFKTGETITTSKEITRAFIDMINKIEKSKTVLSNVR